MPQNGSDGTTVSGSQHRKHCYCEEFKLQYKTFKLGECLKAIFEHRFTIRLTTGFLQVTTDEIYLLETRASSSASPHALPLSPNTACQVKKTCVLPAGCCGNRCVRLAWGSLNKSDELICAEVNCNWKNKHCLKYLSLYCKLQFFPLSVYSGLFIYQMFKWTSFNPTDTVR